MSTKRYAFMGLPIHSLTFDETCELFQQALRSRTPLVHTVLNAGKVVMAGQDPLLAQAIRQADLVNADGQSIVWFGRMAGIPIPERVTGIDLMSSLLQIAEAESARVFLLGASQEVLDAALTRIQKDYPGLIAVSGRHGYFNSADEEAICRQVQAFQPDVLLLGMSSPKKERFAHEHRGELGATITMGVGGAFDIWAGKTKRAPDVWQRLGLEWFYRLLQEPRRMWRRYLIGNYRFIFSWLKWRWQPNENH